MSHSHGFHTAATTSSKATEAAAVPEAAEAEASAGEANAEAVKAKTMANAMDGSLLAGTKYTTYTL